MQFLKSRRVFVCVQPTDTSTSYHPVERGLNSLFLVVFSIAGLTIRNMLDELRHLASGFESFRRFRKTILFSFYSSDQQALVGANGLVVSVDS